MFLKDLLAWMGSALTVETIITLLDILFVKAAVYAFLPLSGALTTVNAQIGKAIYIKIHVHLAVKLQIRS